MRNQVNRLVNCETANLNKTVNAAIRQQEDIRFIVAKIGWEGMPMPLRQVAQVRLEHPDISFKELGELLSPPIGKSGVNHRMKKIEELAEDLRINAQ
jgi:DNA-binding protein WhiA